MESEIQRLPVERLYAHPDNPRLQLREDVVERLVAEMQRGGFRPEHAILARPIDDGWQVVSGHHRVEAGKRCGLAEIPVWVRDMDDDEAFMQLVLGNTQGELSPLEIGMHAATFADDWSGEAKVYSERLGYAESYISQLKRAGKVVRSIQDHRVYLSKLGDLGDKAKHLYEISKAPRPAWPALVERLIAKGWTVSETSREVEQLRRFEVPDEWAEWLPIGDLIASHLRSGKPSAAAVQQLISSAQGILAAIERDAPEDDAEADAARFRAWLVEHRGKESWDRRQLSDFHAGLIREWAERQPDPDEPGLPDGVDLRLGDFRDEETFEGIEDGSIDVIITDPPYPAEFLALLGRKPIGWDEYGSTLYGDHQPDGLSEVAERMLKPGGICAVMIGQSYLPEVAERLSQQLSYHWTLAYLTPGGQAVQLWDRKVNTFWKPVLIYVKGQYDGPWLGDVTRSDVNDNDKRHHHWGQSESGMADLIERLTKPGDLICDPFLGGGTTAVVAHALGRKFIGCDTDEDCVAKTTERFAGGGQA